WRSSDDGRLAMVSRWRFSALCVFLVCVVLGGAGAATATQLTVTWVDNSGGAAMTRIERRFGTDSTYVPLLHALPGGTAYFDTSVSQGTTYCYRAFAWDSAGVSPYTDESCATAASDPTPPSSAVTVSIGKSGNAQGLVTSTPAGIDCGAVCAAN